jgi:hypothetical protein
MPKPTDKTRPLRSASDPPEKKLRDVVCDFPEATLEAIIDVERSGRARRVPGTTVAVAPVADLRRLRQLERLKR